MRYTIVLLVLLCSSFSFAQPIGSGGVNDLSTCRFWYSADDLSLNNLDPVAEWSSFGGNTTSALQGNGGEQPLFTSSSMNSLPSLQFDGSNDFLDIASNNDLDGGGPHPERTFHLAISTSGDITSRQVVYQEGGGTRGLNIYIFNGELYLAGWNFANDGAGSPWGFDFISTPISANTDYYISFIFDGNSTTSGTITGYLNGSIIGTANNIGQLYNHNNATIGSKQSGTVYETGSSGGSGEYFEGEIAELIIYNYAHNTGERIIIENYLSAKYDITPSANDFYTMDDVPNGNYDFDVAGIGQETGGGNNNNDAQGRNPFRILNPSGLDDNEYLLWGHDGNNGAITSNNTDIPAVGSITTRIDRVWRASESGDISSYDIQYNTSCAAFTPNNTYLLIDTDADGIFSDEVSGVGVFAMTDLGGGLFELSGTGAITNSTLFTFGFDGAPSSSYATVPGPGGIGDNSVNRFWFDANNLGLANGAAVQTWGNLGGNSEDFTQATNSNRPTFLTNQLNGFPSISFDGTNDHFDMNDNNDLNSGGPWEERSFFIVFNSGTDITSRQVIYEEGGGTRGINAYIFNNSLYVGAWNENNDSPNTPWGFYSVNTGISVDTDYILSFHYKGNDCRTGTIEVYLDGSLVGTMNRLGLLYNHTGDISIGSEQNDSYYENGPSTGNTDVNFFEGSVSEFIVYNYKVNTSQRIIIENSLSGKYGLTLNSNDIYTMDNGGNGDYDHEIAGIGRENGFEEDNDSRGRGMVRINNSSNLGNNDYFIWGHDNAPIASFGVSDYPASEGVEGRIDRVWRPTEQGETGTMDVIFDLSAVGGSKTAADLVLLVDRNNNGVFADETYAGTGIIGGAVALGGDVFQFSGVNINNAQRFTVGTIDQTNTPLPVEWLSFEITKKNDDVELVWSTASENNNNYFEVLKSLDGEHFSPIGIVKGHGTTPFKSEYSFTDQEPYNGVNYYQIRQVDFNGESSYTSIKSIPFDLDFKLYPHPVLSGGTYTIEGINDSYSIQVFNSNGKLIQEVINTQTHVFNAPAENGIYLLKIITESGVLTQRLIVQ